MVLLPKPPEPKTKDSQVKRNVFFENDEMDLLATRFVGNNYRFVQIFQSQSNITSIGSSFIKFETTIKLFICLNIFFRYRENIVIPNMLGPAKIKTNEEKMIESVVESCFFKSFMACVLGNNIYFSNL